MQIYFYLYVSALFTKVWLRAELEVTPSTFLKGQRNDESLGTIIEATHPDWRCRK